jgi:uncharacterized protein YqgC (DUF456 family)
VTTRWLGPAVVASLMVLAVVAVFRMQTSVADFDPQYMRVLVERRIALGGSYYQNGVHNKGPFEAVVYEAAARIGRRDGFWFVIALFALGAACAVGLAAAVTARRFGSGRFVGWSAMAAAVAHLTLSTSDYAGVLYARNLTVAMLAAAFVIAAVDRLWVGDRRQTFSSIATGMLLGLAVQTMLTAVFTAFPLAAWIMWRRRAARVGPRSATALIPVVAALVFVSAPLWYLVTGRWRPFIDGWWVYARFMSSATGRTLGEQYSLGLDQFAEYYRDRPWVFAGLIVFLALSAFRWRVALPLERSLRLLLGSWWLGAWIELMLGQRYSSHYFSVLAVPTILIFASLIGDGVRPLRPDRLGPILAVLPIVGVLVALAPSGSEPIREGAASASAFRGISHFTDERDRGLDPRTRMVRASLDLVSAPGEPLLIWTNRPWPYLELRRISATRYIWRSFMLGQIYLAGEGEQYVLPNTWEQFEHDVGRTDPTAFVVETVDPVAPDTPFARLVDDRFTTMYTDDAVTLAYRSDLAGWLRRPPADARPGRLEVIGGVEQIVDSACRRIDGTLSIDPAGVHALRFGFPLATSDGLGAPELVVEADGRSMVRVTSVYPSRGVFEATVRADLDDIAFTLTIGARSAVMMIDGDIVGAVELDRAVAATVASTAPALGVSGLTTSPPIEGSGC